MVAVGAHVLPGGAARATHSMEPMSKVTRTKLREDGLRYAAKASGSPFLGTGSTRSCFKCGRHRQASQLQSKRVLGRSEMVCKPACHSVV
jgi:hypothetical protein